MATITKTKIRNNYEKLRAVYGPLGLSSVNDVWALHRLDQLEVKLHHHAEMACNVPLSENQERYHERYEKNAIAEVERMLPMLVGKMFVNGDPRGYALKIHDKHGELIESCGIATDWGRYGLIAPSAQFIYD